MDDKKEYVERVFLMAKMRGLVKTQGDFAKLLDVDRTTLSGAFHGKPINLTDRFVRRVRRWAEANGIEDAPGGDQKQQQAEPAQGAGFLVPEEFRKTMENMTETIRIQAQIIAGLQPRSVDAFLGQSKKTFLADGD